VVGCGGAGFEELHATAGVGCGLGDDGGEVRKRDVVRARTGDERAAGREQAERSQVELFVAAEGRGGSAFGFGEGRRVEHDGVENQGFFLIEMAEVFEGIGFDPIDFGFEIGVESEIGVGGFECGAAGVDASDAGAGLGEMQGEAAVVGADVERVLSAC